MESETCAQSLDTSEESENSADAEKVTRFQFLDNSCRVCKSLSTGVHYGVATCEGCKGFFKRSIPKQQHYKCYFGGDCEINRETRNRCKSCRFRRCITVGMALEAVKMGRIPKGDKERALRILEGTPHSDPGDDRPSKIQKTLAPAVKPSLPLTQPEDYLTAEAPLLRETSCITPNSSTSLRCAPPTPLQLVPSSISHPFSENIDVHPFDFSPPLPTFHSCESPLIKVEPFEANGSFGGGWCIPHKEPASDHRTDLLSEEALQSPFLFDSFPMFTPGERSPSYLTLHSSSVGGFRKIARALHTSEQTSALDQSSRGSSPFCSAADQLGNIPRYPSNVSLNLGFSPFESTFGRASPVSPTVTGKQSVCDFSSDSGLDSRSDNSCNWESESAVSRSSSLNSTSSHEITVGITDDPAFIWNDSLCSWDFQPAKVDGVQGSILRLFMSSGEKERIKLLENVILTIDKVGNDVYRKETTECVEFMVKMWKEGRLVARPSNEPEASPLVIRDRLKESVETIVNSTLRFSSRIPGIAEVNEDDFRRLLEQCVFEIWMIQHAAFLVNNESYIMLSSTGPSLQYTRQLMSHFLPENMICGLMKFADEINPHQFTFLELNILKAMIVVCPDREGLRDEQTIRNLRWILQEALYQVFKRRMNCSADDMLEKLKNLMPKLSDLNNLHKHCVASVNLELNEIGRLY